MFDLVDKAVNFVLSKIDLAVGNRTAGPEVPVAYEIPPEAISEAIVNAVAHRDYTSTASVQVMLFSDRLEVWNPGTLPPALNLKTLREPHGSFPGNPLIAEPLYLAKYIERMGTGIHDMIERCREAGLPEPEFKLTDGFVTIIRRKPGLAFAAVGGEITPEATPEATPEVTPEVERMLSVMQGEMTRREIQEKLGLTDEKHFRECYQQIGIKSGLIEMTIPDKPRSKRQQYRLTAKGRAWIDARRKEQTKE